MKSRAATLALMLASGALHAGGGHSVTINASVLGSCRFATGTSSLGFVVDPAGTSTLSQTGAVQFTCAKGSIVPVVTLKSASTGSAAGGNLLRGGDAVPYTFTSTVAGNGKNRTLSVSVSISQPAAANVSPGVYADTIAITLAP